MTESLECVLGRFDGKKTAPLKLYLPLAQADPDRLLECCANPNYAVAATWVLKALVERDGAKGIDLGKAFDTLPIQQHWEARLHLLQIVKYAPVRALKHQETVLSMLCADKTLLQVWALDALVHLAEHDAALRPVATQTVANAGLATPASLRARARALKRICTSW